jgi:hypothetical protein
VLQFPHPLSLAISFLRQRLKLSRFATLGETMKHYVLVVCAFIGCTTGLAQTENCKECRHVLQGLFNDTSIMSKQQNHDDFNRYLCTTDFGTHEEAQSYGMKVGMPVYDVPLQISGQFDKSQKDNWKKTHCEATAASSTSATSLVMFVRKVSPEIAKQWLECVKAVCAPQSGLSCSDIVSSGQLSFLAQWRRGTGDEQAPRVVRFTTVNASCIQAPVAGQIISDAGRVVVCQIGGQKIAPLVALETTRGTCYSQGSGLQGTLTLAGRIELGKAEHYQTGQLTITGNTKIVTNGNRLVLEADEIKLEGAPQIVAFESGAEGKGAGEIIVKARLISGTSLAIQNQGQKGRKGATGSAGVGGAGGGGGSQRDTLCGGGKNGDPGGPGGQGGTGGTGGIGGAGGTVTIDVIAGLDNGGISRVSGINVAGGPGGDGGDPGPGGPGGPGGGGAPGTANCNGTQPGSNGPAGPAGPAGQPGSQGTRGNIIYTR